MSSISSEEITEWAAYYQLDPWGGYRGDVQAALIVHWMVKLLAKKGTDMKLSDFVLQFGLEERERGMSQQEILDHIRSRMSTIHHG